MPMSKNSLKQSSTTRLAHTALSLVCVMQQKKIHGCDYMDNMRKIAFDAITILSHLGKNDTEIMGYAIALLNRYEGALNE